MKISLNSIRNMNMLYGCADDVAAIGVKQLVEKIGAQLGAVEEIIDLGAKYRNIIIAKVVSCEQHPNADRLKVCKIDDGSAAKSVERDENQLVRVVCGAPNVRPDMFVAWLPPGSTVPESVDNEPFVLEARELRGVVSNGMLASPKELALGDSHDGILEIDESIGEIKTGSDFAEVFGLKDDIILDIENKMFTHRPDCFGFLGVSRELAGIQRLPFKSPDWYVPAPIFPESSKEKLLLEIKNELPQLVPRFTAVAISSVRVGPSPVWLQIELAKVGARSINNIVDYTNYFMLLTGQPLHAYDYDKVKALSEGEGATIVVRQPCKGETVKLLNGKTIEPRPEAIMIATNKALIGVGGVMGGADTEVDAATKNIILECANFDMYSVRRTSMAHGLFTDAVSRFNKGQSPLQNLAVLAKIADEIVHKAGGKVSSSVVDSSHLDGVFSETSVHPPVQISEDFINTRLGLSLSAEEVINLLQNTEFTVVKNAHDLTVIAPFWRTDIVLPEDIVEEVGRLYGYDKLPLTLPGRDLTPVKKDPLLELKTQIRTSLSKAGANEVLTYSFVPDSLFQKTVQDESKAFKIGNALSPDLQYYRLSIMPSLLEKVHANIKAGYNEFALFEIGRTHSLDHLDEQGLPLEFEFTGLVVTANDKLKRAGAAYYQARNYLQNLAGVELTFKPVSEAMQAYPVVQPYSLDRAALVSLKQTGEFLGIIGEFKDSVRQALKLPKYTAGFEIDTTVLQAVFDTASGYKVLPRFPYVNQDITLKVPTSLAYQELYDFVWSGFNQTRPDKALISLNPIDIYQRLEDTAHKQITLRLSIASYERTLTDTEVNKLLGDVAAAANNEFGAERV